MIFNKLREDIIDYLNQEYSREDSENQICNANVSVIGDRISVIYDNGVSETLFYNGSKIESWYDSYEINRTVELLGLEA